MSANGGGVASRLSAPDTGEQGTEVRFSRCFGLRSHRRWRLLRPCPRSRPATSGRFRRKWAPISPWSWTSVRFSAGVVRCRLRRPGEMPAPRGVSSRFGLQNRPEVYRWGSRVARGARRHCGEQERGFRQAASVWSLRGRSVPHAHRGMGVAWRRRRVRTGAMHHDEGRPFHGNISRTAWRPQPRISRSNPR